MSERRRGQLFVGAFVVLLLAATVALAIERQPAAIMSGTFAAMFALWPWALGLWEKDS